MKDNSLSSKKVGTALPPAEKVSRLKANPDELIVIDDVNLVQAIIDDEYFHSQFDEDNPLSDLYKEDEAKTEK